MVPTWVAVLTGVGGIVVGIVVTPVVELVKARMTTSQAREAADATHQRETSKSDRELIKQALELARKDDPLAKRQGYALLNGLSQMSGLSADDAILVQALTRPLIERTLSEGRRSEEIAGEEVEYHFDLYEEEGQEEADAPDQGHP